MIDLVVALVGCGVGWSMRDHDQHLDSFKRRLFELPVPDGARVTERRSVIGDGHSELSDLGFEQYRDHCEYRVSIVVETDLGVSGLGSFYEQADVDTAGLSIGVFGPDHVKVEDIDQGKPDWDPRCNRGVGL